MQKNAGMSYLKQIPPNEDPRRIPLLDASRLRHHDPQRTPRRLPKSIPPVLAPFPTPTLPLPTPV